LSARTRLRTGADLPVPRCLSPSRKTRRALAARARRRHRVANRRWATAGAGGGPWPALWLAEARAESFLGRRSAVRDIAAGYGVGCGLLGGGLMVRRGVGELSGWLCLAGW